MGQLVDLAEEGVHAEVSRGKRLAGEFGSHIFRETSRLVVGLVKEQWRGNVCTQLLTVTILRSEHKGKYLVHGCRVDSEELFPGIIEDGLQNDLGKGVELVSELSNEILEKDT